MVDNRGVISRGMVSWGMVDNRGGMISWGMVDNRGVISRGSVDSMDKRGGVISRGSVDSMDKRGGMVSPTSNRSVSTVCWLHLRETLRVVYLRDRGVGSSESLGLH